MSLLRFRAEKSYRKYPRASTPVACLYDPRLKIGVLEARNPFDYYATSANGRWNCRYQMEIYQIDVWGCLYRSRISFDGVSWEALSDRKRVASDAILREMDEGRLYWRSDNE